MFMMSSECKEILENQVLATNCSCGKPQISFQWVSRNLDNNRYDKIFFRGTSVKHSLIKSGLIVQCLRATPIDSKLLSKGKDICVFADEVIKHFQFEISNSTKMKCTCTSAEFKIDKYEMQ